MTANQGESVLEGDAMSANDTQTTRPAPAVVEREMVDMWIDFACPWSYIAHHEIASAPIRTPLRVRAFQLNPDLPEAGIMRQAYRVNKFGSQNESDRRDDRVIAVGRQAGLNIDFTKVSLTPNTRNAHRAIKAAVQQGANSIALTEAIFGSYFMSGSNIGKPEVLVAIAKTVGIVLTAADLDPSAGHDKMIDRDTADARTAGLTGVPYFADATTQQPIRTADAINALTGAVQ